MDCRTISADCGTIGTEIGEDFDLEWENFHLRDFEYNLEGGLQPIAPGYECIFCPLLAEVRVVY